MMTVFAVVRANGEVKRTRNAGLCIYPRKSTAQGQAKAEGDSVVELEIDLTKPPLFIRGQKVVS